MSLTDLKPFQEGRLRMAPDEMRAYWGGQPIALSRTMFLILYDMASSPEKLKDRERLLNYAWGESINVLDRSVDTMMKRLRIRFRKVDPDFNQIDTVYQIGYRWRKE